MGGGGGLEITTGTFAEVSFKTVLKTREDTAMDVRRERIPLLLSQFLKKREFQCFWAQFFFFKEENSSASEHSFKKEKRIPVLLSTV